MTWANRTTIYHNTWSVQATEGHQHTRHVLVTARHHDTAIEPMATHAAFNAVSDEISTRERIRHGACTHTDTIRHTDRAKLVARDTSVVQ